MSGIVRSVAKATPGVDQCSIAGCIRRVKDARSGWCNAHYRRNLRHGSPCGGTLGQRELIQFLEGAARAKTDECILVDWHSRRPNVTYRGLRVNASRAVWVIANGDPGRLHVLHSCHKGDEGCVNIRHLHLGTNHQNRQEMVEVERQARGVKNSQAKLTEIHVREIRKLYAEGHRQGVLAATFNVSQTNIGQIVRRVTWKHVADEGCVA